MTFHLRPHLSKSNLYVARKQNKKKFFFYFKINKEINFSSQHKKGEVMSFHLRPYLLKLVENFLKYLTLGAFSGSVATKRLFRHNIFESTWKRFADPQSVHQNLSFELWTTFVPSIFPNLNPPSPPKPGILAFFNCSLII